MNYRDRIDELASPLAVDEYTDRIRDKLPSATEADYLRLKFIKDQHEIKRDIAILAIGLQDALDALERIEKDMKDYMLLQTQTARLQVWQEERLIKLEK